MKRCAVVIGVNKAGKLHSLKAAASDATEFAAWAKSQGIDVTLLTDDSGDVSLGKIKDAIRFYVQQQTYSQLIVFFSGHGILRGPDYELWLLSGAPDDPDEAVNVPGSIWLARSVGIPHIVIISDACRSLPRTLPLSQVEGGKIFPNESPKTPRPAVDVFYAALPGDPALETTNEADNHHGLFTNCLLKGLKGNVPNLIVNIIDPKLNVEKWGVPSWELKPYLEQEVPDAAAKIHIKLQQEPDIRVESHQPHYLAEVMRPKSMPILRPASVIGSKQASLKLALRSLDVGNYIQRYVDDGSLLLSTQQIAELDKMTADVNRLMVAKGRRAFETRTGFSVIGTTVKRAVVTGSVCDLFQENGAYHIRVHDDGHTQKPRSALIQITGDSVIPLAVLYGYIGTVVVENGRVVTVTYLPSSNTRKYDDYQYASDDIEQRRAFVAVAARNGVFQPTEAIEVARYLRRLKAIDPTLGLYSAYAYAQAGDFEGIESVFDYMRREPEPVLFDVAMLANKLDNEPRSGALPLFEARTLPFRDQPLVTPFCPMLTQGWAFLDTNNALLPQAVRRVRKSLQPGLWTTFTKKGGEYLYSFVEDGGLG